MANEEAEEAEKKTGKKGKKRVEINPKEILKNEVFLDLKQT